MMKNAGLIGFIGVGMVALLAGLSFGGDRVTGSDRQSAAVPDRNQAIFSATEIIHYPDRDLSIGRFDARTGAIYRFRGSVDNPSVRNVWELRVPPARGQHSGYLEIQQIYPALPSTAHITPDARREVGRATNSPHSGREAPATFLVDVKTGDTWILRLRSNENGTWEPVLIHN